MSVLRDWLQERCPSSTLRGCLDSGDTGSFEQQFAAEGWSGVGSPEDLGGQGGGLVELALVAEELVQVESARSIVYLAAASVEAGHPDAHLHAAAAKAQVTADAADAADAALTVHGAGTSASPRRWSWCISVCPLISSIFNPTRGRDRDG